MSYDAAIKTAKKLIKAKGQSVKWCKKVITKSASQPWKIEDSEVEEANVDICFLPVNRSNLETYAQRDGVSIARVSAIGYMGAVDFTPSIGDYIERDGKNLSIEYIDVVAPSGVPILYTILFRG